MAEIAELGLKITSDDVVTATRRLDKLEEQSKKTETATHKNAGAFDMLKRALPIVALGATIKAVLGVANSYQELNSKLLTATGSQEAANLAFGTLRNLAFEMPGSIEEVTNSFIKLNNLGLNPSREALISYGNTAAAMGKSLDQLIEAVADAATGEFERLKEFGIKSRNEGDKIAFTFQGITTRVDNTSDAIQKYLINIGNNQFAGAMEKQNKTLGAAFTDLADSIGLATNKLATESGFVAWVSKATSEIARMFRVMSGTESISDMESRLEELKKTLKSLKEESGGWFAFATGGAAETSGVEAKIAELEKKIAEERAKERKQAAATEQAQRDKDLSKDLEKLRESTKTQLEIVEEQYAQRQALIDEALLTEQMTEQEHQEQMQRIQKEYADKRIKLKEAEKQALLAVQTGIADNLSSLMASGSKKQFEIGKIAAVASALIKGREAVLGAYAAGSKVGGPLLGGIYAGTAGIAVGTQINAIKNTQFSGGGTVSAPGGGAAGTAPLPTPPALQDQQGQSSPTNVTVNVTGQPTIQMIRDMMDGISEQVKANGGRLGDIQLVTA